MTSTAQPSLDQLRQKTFCGLTLLFVRTSREEKIRDVTCFVHSNRERRERRTPEGLRRMGLYRRRTVAEKDKNDKKDEGGE